MTMQPWFAEARLGIFIHYGIYAVDGVEESWSMYSGEVSREDYLRQLDGFTARDYDPRAWADLFARAGASYAVLTSKHHDGVALWDAPGSVFNVVKHTPASRDLLVPYAEALRERGLKVGLYFSHADWTHPDYATVSHENPEMSWVADNRLSTAARGQEEPERWARFRADYHAQLLDLATRYRPDLLWFDGEWERSDEQWGMRELGDSVLSINPQTMFNGRMRTHADYATPEQALPFTPPDGPWEFNLTVNDSWGYRGGDTNWKSVRQLVRYFAETIGMGGKLLLDVGPRADGTIPAEAVHRLEGLGGWIAKHAEAVFGTLAGLPPGHHYGPSLLSKDRRTLYLVCLDQPREHLAVRGLITPVKQVRVVGSGTPLGHRVTGGLGEHPGHLWIDAPTGADLDPHATVLAVELEDALSLYTGPGRA